MSTLSVGNDARESQARDAGKRLPVSCRKFDARKITQFNGLCELGSFDEYWLRPVAWTRKFRREILTCDVPLSFWTHYALFCCGDVVTKLWEKEFETPGNVEPDWQPGLLLEIQDDGGEGPYTHMREWSFFVRWLCGQFKTPGLYHIERRVFEDFTIEDIYVRSLLLPPGNNFDTELAMCSGPVMRMRSSYLWKLNSYRNMLWKSKKDQLVSLELYRLVTGTSRLISSRKNITSPSRLKDGTTPSGVSVEAEVSFRQRVTSEFPPLCVDSLPPDGPAAIILDGSAFHVKLRLKEGVQPQGRRPYRIPESYRPEMEKTIPKLLEFKIIEPSFSQYSNPVFLVHIPSLRDGSSGGLRFVWDGRSVNRTIKTDSFLIPRVEDLIERIARLKHETSAKGCSEMWISTLELRTSFWQLTLDEDSRPLISFSTPEGRTWGRVFQWVF
jgi:hypothetical protein